MLVLGRRKGESIIIGDDIEISIIDIQNEVVKIGINAPRQVSIVRKEIYEEVREANREAVRNVREAGAISRLWKREEK
ncbi:carbon storage regulator, CsrA [Thermosyntropha lipolytica DSM 11003]|uniref:Translational regulator CsrA n=1 Tax=Thermosyntropha lipolytica DSM 11003 TaxID=1123382 RepID=A0A1M5KN36_9FIRM|nr:carbon storage regulator CsrA [Thermosyntropha lipolytica]SHG54244.1 carbon storage regulator, CsrA [Thermosyntropha lipolytica DSM 11003]